MTSVWFHFTSASKCPTWRLIINLLKYMQRFRETTGLVGRAVEELGNPCPIPILDHVSLAKTFKTCEPLLTENSNTLHKAL